MPQPYSITDKQGIAYFTADNQAIYKALFLQVSFSGEPQLEGFIVDFSFDRDITNCPDTTRRAKDGSFKKRVGNKDERIQATVKQIVSSFFESNPYHVVYFTCESIDSKHRGRIHMFEEWYREHQDTFTKVPFIIPGGIVDEEITPDTYGGAIFMKSHPLHELIYNFVNSEVLVYTSSKSMMFNS
ncbi:DUF6169 family protein [Hymenobacter fodinae]|uniref:Uncharacterized protein n=1 Tax=Hymenobacter fodinae TaxID=2510796 RepID=A0A4Z0P5Z9_9BACT|nr:DUF6169 family protein [Hymenobacter fodinae]TGE07711.1 hypothetical protein EU556_08125 [Hymenobacter fodinae]